MGQGLVALLELGVRNGSTVNCMHIDCGGRLPMYGGMAFFEKVQEAALVLFASAIDKVAADLLP